MAHFPFPSLRAWLEFLEEEGQLVHNQVEVDLRGDVAAISRKISEAKAEAVLHENIRGYPGWKVFSDGLATRQRLAWALGLEPETMVQRLSALLLTGKGIRPRVVPTGPCKEVKLFEDDIDLTQLPVPFTGQFDTPPYITAGISNIRDPETGWQNSGIRRYQLKGRRRLTNLIQPIQHEGMIFSKYLKAGKPMPIAIVLGADPLYYMLSLMPAPDQVDEMDYWGLFAGQELEVVRCETSDITVPAGAEIIIEGEIDPEKRVLEGPFPEFPGYYSGYNVCPIIEVKAITMRSDAIYQYMYMGKPPTEGHVIADFMVETEIYRQVKPIVTELKDVAVLTCMGITVAASVDKRARLTTPGLVKRLGVALRGVAASKIVKNLFIVDDDVDVHNMEDLLWSFSVKFQPSRDISVLADIGGFFLDPSEPWTGLGPGHSSFALFDCTEKPPPYDEGYKRGLATPPAEACRRVEEDWARYGFGRFGGRA